MAPPEKSPARRSDRFLIILDVVLTLVVMGVLGWRYFSPQADARLSRWRPEMSRPVVMPFHRRGGLPPPPENHESLPTVSTLGLDRG